MEKLDMGKKQGMPLMIAALCVVPVSLLLSSCPTVASEGKSDNTPDWFYPKAIAEAHYNKPIVVRDTDSALGRYSLKTKEISLKDLARVHGHLCDGLVIAFIEIKAALEKLFPDGVVDRTDLRAVSKNGPCWVDAAALMTGARINFKTLRLDAIGDGFIIQRISTGEAYDVHLKPGVFPDDQAALENKIRKLRSEGKPVSAEDIDAVEAMACAFNIRLLTAPPDQLIDIKTLDDFKFIPNETVDVFGARGDSINKGMPR
jgi:formylmethanofuran dehydrogenase subunit E